MVKINKLKMKILSFIHKGKNIVKYKRSYKHPLINKELYNGNLGYFRVKKIWNIKTYVKYCDFMYEENPHINWDWKVEIQKDTGIYIVNLVDLFSGNGLFDKQYKKVSDEMMFIFYK